jgi:hypothetical protein
MCGKIFYKRDEPPPFILPCCQEENKKWRDLPFQLSNMKHLANQQEENELGWPIYIDGLNSGSSLNYLYNLKPLREKQESSSYHHRTDTHPPWPCLPSTQASWSRRVSSASKLPDAPGYCSVTPGLRPRFEVQTEKPSSDGFMSQTNKPRVQCTRSHHAKRKPHQVFHLWRLDSLLDLVSSLASPCTD